MGTQLQRRRWVYSLLFVVSFVLLVFTCPMVQAQEFPAKPITLIIPYGPGGGFDLPSRLLASLAMDYFRQPIVVQFKPGGGGSIGSEFVANAAPDGYTMLIGSPGSQSIYPAVENKSKGPDDLAAVCRINYAPIFVCAHPSVPFHTFKEMLAWAKANPGKMTYGNTGPWSAADLPWRQTKLITGMVTRDVPHDGGGPALMAVLGGHVMVAGINATQAIPQLRAGKIRPLAVWDHQRHPAFPNVPTAKEEGVDVVFLMWKGIFVPKATPRPIIDKLAANLKKIVEDKFFVGTLKKIDEDIHYLGPDEFTKLWRSEYENYKELGRMLKK